MGGSCSVEEDLKIVSYEGERDEKGLMHGTGVAIFLNNDRYEGQFENNKMHGIEIKKRKI